MMGLAGCFMRAALYARPASVGVIQARALIGNGISAQKCGIGRAAIPPKVVGAFA
jgi:hypothetical protein